MKAQSTRTRCPSAASIAIVVAVSFVFPASASEVASDGASGDASGIAAVPSAATPLDVYVGLNVRTDLGVHPVRFDGGVRLDDWDFTLTVDPMAAVDHLMSTDVLVAWHSSVGVAPIVGWRLTTVGLVDGAQFQENLIVGAAADLPTFFDGLLRCQAGLEVAATVVRHGGGLPAETIGFSSGRSYIDLINVALFVRGEFVVPL